MSISPTGPLAASTVRPTPWTPNRPSAPSRPAGRPASIAKTGDGMVEAMRLLKLARDSAVNDRTKAINQLRAIVVGADPALRESLAALGPDSVAALLIAAGDNPGRLRREGSYAALCGASTVEASSGDTQRRRLNRGGDRQANAALYRITMSRLRWDQRTQDYLQRRLGDGKTHREAVRCLKRYIAREIFALLPGPARRPGT
jgi:transposase